MEVVLGVCLLGLGLAVAPLGTRAYHGVYVLGGVLGFLTGWQTGAVAPLFAEPLGVPLVHALLGTVTAGAMLSLGVLVALVAVPFLVGAQVGRRLFDEWVLAVGTGSVTVAAAVVVVIAGSWLFVALSGGVSVAAGVQLLSGVADTSGTYAAAAARRVPEPAGATVAGQTLQATGAVTESWLLLGVVVCVGLVGGVGALLTRER